MIKKLFSKRNKHKKAEEKQEEKKSAQLDTILNELNINQQNTISILLLGAGGSGKSTILKQIEKIYRGSINDKILKNAAFYIKQNILEDIYDLSTQNKSLKNQINPITKHDAYLSSLISNNYLRIICIHLNLFIPPEIIILITKYYYFCSIELSQDSQIICNQIVSLKGGDLEESELTQDLAKKISILWNDKALQETFKLTKYQYHMDNTPYLFDNIDKICHPQYIADFEDYIRLRQRTSGIIEQEVNLNIDGGNKNKYLLRLKITDVGGQRTERRKWLRCLTDIHAIFWVMALDGFDKRLYEDDTQNCYDEALNLFETTMKHEALQTIDVIVFFNKNDLFLRKIKKVPFSVFDPTFNKDLIHNAHAVKEYLRHEYKKRFYGGIKADKSPRKIRFFPVSAIDTKSIQNAMHLMQYETRRPIMRVGMLM